MKCGILELTVSFKGNSDTLVSLRRFTDEHIGALMHQLTKKWEHFLRTKSDLINFFRLNFSATHSPPTQLFRKLNFCV